VIQDALIVARQAAAVASLHPALLALDRAILSMEMMRLPSRQLPVLPAVLDAVVLVGEPIVHFVGAGTGERRSSGEGDREDESNELHAR